MKQYQIYTEFNFHKRKSRKGAINSFFDQILGHGYFLIIHHQVARFRHVMTRMW